MDPDGKMTEFEGGANCTQDRGKTNELCGIGRGYKKYNGSENEVVVVVQYLFSRPPGTLCRAQVSQLWTSNYTYLLIYF